MKVEFEKGRLVIRLRIWKPRPSASGKSMLIASTRGPKRAKVKFKGKVFHVSANVYYKRSTPPRKRPSAPPAGQEL